MTLSLFSDEYFMQVALKEAQKAFDADEVPVGAVIICNNTIIAKAHNFTQRLNDATAHAEMQAYTSAAAFLGSKYLNECTLYVSLEPCFMCAGAAMWTQLKRIVYAARDTKKGYSLSQMPIIHPKTEVLGGVLEQEAALLLKTFFAKKCR